MRAAGRMCPAVIRVASTMYSISCAGVSLQQTVATVAQWCVRTTAKGTARRCRGLEAEWQGGRKVAHFGVLQREVGDRVQL